MTAELIILVPCYNEFNRLNSEKYSSFAKTNPQCTIVFCNDGSTDKTLVKLQEIKAISPQNILIFDSEKNRGKAEIIRHGVEFCNSQNIDYQKIAYLDADLSTSLEECLQLSTNISSQIVFVFGSRISKIDNTIERKLYRHFLGRVIATFISISLKISVYDTQCGCKIIDGKIAQQLFYEKFISKWLFDVELFFRMIKIFGRQEMKNVCREIPLHQWIAVKDSKVSFAYGLKLWWDLYAIHKKYR